MKGKTASFVVASLLFMLEGQMDTARQLLDSYFLAFATPAAHSAEAPAPVAVDEGKGEGEGEGEGGGPVALPRPAAFDPLALYVLYLSLQDRAVSVKGAPSWLKAQAADCLRAVRCFPAVAGRFLGDDDTLDAEVPDAEFDHPLHLLGENSRRLGLGGGGGGSGEDDEEVDEQTAMELSDERADADDPDGPEAAWRALSASCEPMDKLMALTGLREVKRRAIQTYLSTRVRDAASGFFRGSKVNTASNAHLVLIGNPGKGSCREGTAQHRARVTLCPHSLFPLFFLLFFLFSCAARQARARPPWRDCSRR